MNAPSVTLTQRTVALPGDLAALAELINACEAADRLGQGTAVEELGESLTEPDLDLTRDSQLWLGPGGRLVAATLLRLRPAEDGVDAFGWFYIHPELRASGLGEQALAWTEARCQALGREQGQPITLRTRADETDAYRRRLFEAHGLTIARYFLRLERSLAEPIPAPAPPEGYRIRLLAGREEMPAWVETFNSAFADHWNHHPLTVEQALHYMTASFYRPDLDLVAVAPDGSLAGFCYCEVKEAENQRAGRDDGWIGLLGTRREHRGQGLGQALLLAGLGQLREAGVAAARLMVDADNPTGATRLYERAGFRVSATFLTYARPGTAFAHGHQHE